MTDLRQEGWRVLEAATGVGALQALHEAEKVDLLITDISLADALTGWSMSQKRSESPTQSCQSSTHRETPQTIIAELREVFFSASR